jgi:signal peptidase
MNIKDLKKMFLQFWRNDNKKIMFIRDISVILLTIFVILLLLWTYTGQWFASPIVAIESGSMEHTPPMFPTDPPFGRLGTIDAGDMVLVQKVYLRNDVAVYGGDLGGAQAKNGWQSYGDYGDVIIYHPDGNKNITPIIHRAMCWVEVETNGNQIRYTIKEFGIYNETSIGPIPELGLDLSVKPNWKHSGFLTKGDNNELFDNLPDQGIYESSQPVKLGWISGKARLEIPWFGAINLFFSDIMNGTNNVGNVHEDCLTCLVILIAILVLIPISLDVKDYWKQKKKDEV